MTMLDSELAAQLPLVYADSNLDYLGQKHIGKVRDSYVRGDVRYLVATDRLSCFDVVVTSLPFKGEVLTQLAAHWFKLIDGIVPHHVIDVPDPQVMVVKNGVVIPIEVVVRGYLAGGGWRAYQKAPVLSGVKLPPGLTEFAKLPEAMLTPSTKAPQGEHDEAITVAEIVNSGIVSRQQWDEIAECSLALFARATEHAARQGLILVDTKFEFALCDNKLTLVDEIFTLDSSRYWIAETYQSRLSSGEAPQMLDKEPVRRWLVAAGYMGEGAVPQFTDQHRCELARHYIDAFAQITGAEFRGVGGDVDARIRGRVR